MTEIFNIPQVSGLNFQQFFASTVSGAATAQVWKKPEGCNFVHVFAVGGGGGGGNGRTSAASNPRGGGGGGGSGVVSRILIPAHHCPDLLYVRVGQGGDATVGGTGSYVAASATLNAAVDIFINALGGGAGGTGTGGAAGAAGAAGAPPTETNNSLCLNGIVNLGAAVAGAPGGAPAGANGVNVPMLTTVCITGGAGGASTTSANFAGGNITVPSFSTFLTEQLNGGAAGSNNGQNGYTIFKPFFASVGGAGGGSNNTGVGGDGGDGGLGSGGGGGGGGTTGGTGGRGGDGYVAIIAW